MRKMTAFSVIVLFMGMLAWASDAPWKSKPYDQWTEKDVNQIFQESPWAKSNLEAAGAWHPLGQSATTGQAAYGGARTSSVADGGAEKTRDAMASVQMYSVYWWSSRTIRAASCRTAVLHGTMTQAEAAKLVAEAPSDYEVRVRGNNMSIFAQRGEKAFEDAAWLELKKSKSKLMPTRVTFERSDDEKTVLSVTFYFAKDKNGEPTISPEEKEIDFFLKVGDAKVITDFDPRKMRDAQGEDL